MMPGPNQEAITLVAAELRKIAERMRQAAMQTPTIDRLRAVLRNLGDQAVKTIKPVWPVFTNQPFAASWFDWVLPNLRYCFDGGRLPIDSMDIPKTVWLEEAPIVDCTGEPVCNFEQRELTEAEQSEADLHGSYVDQAESWAQLLDNAARMIETNGSQAMAQPPVIVPNSDQLNFEWFIEVGATHTSKLLKAVLTEVRSARTVARDAEGYATQHGLLDEFNNARSRHSKRGPDKSKEQRFEEIKASFVSNHNSANAITPN